MFEQFPKPIHKVFLDIKQHTWERDQKWDAHEPWKVVLGSGASERTLAAKDIKDIAEHAIRMEPRTYPLLPFEKMTLRDAVRTPHGPRILPLEMFTRSMAIRARSEASNASWKGSITCPASKREGSGGPW